MQWANCKLHSGFLLRGGSEPLTPLLFKGQLYLSAHPLFSQNLPESFQLGGSKKCLILCFFLDNVFFLN